MKRQRKFIVLQNKYDLTDLKIRFGYIFYHNDLFDRGYKRNYNCVGGGYWDVDFDSKTIKLYGKSEQYGCTNKNILDIVVEDYFIDFHDKWMIEYATKFSYDLEDEPNLSKFKFEIE